MNLKEALENYIEKDVYPFHMPGHKRQVDCRVNPYDIDITEIDGFDDLHDPSGIIAQEQQRLSKLYRSDKSYILVNGSTAGNLAAVYAAIKPGEEILIGRNSHKSIYHAALLRQAKVSYVYPKADDEFESILDAVSLEDVKKALEEHPQTKAVVITSPTYEGLVSPVRDIAKEVHTKGAVLIVDAAHGAHLGFSKKFPESPVDQGADYVIMSLHKTMPSLTQTAVLHTKGDRVNYRKLEQGLHMFQTSSPSYVLMSSISECIRMVSENPGLFDTFSSRIQKVYNASKKWKNIRLLNDSIEKKDPSKLVIVTKGYQLTGNQLSVLLREKYRLEIEMSSFNYCIAMTGLTDSEEGIDRLIKALSEIDSEVKKIQCQEQLCSVVGQGKKIYELHQAVDMDSEEVLIENVLGRIAADFVIIYPPGSPVVVPGEEITSEIIGLIKKAQENGLHVTGINKDKISVVG